jgi:hypothetical protein
MMTSAYVILTVLISVGVSQAQQPNIVYILADDLGIFFEVILKTLKFSKFPYSTIIFQMIQGLMMYLGTILP